MFSGMSNHSIDAKGRIVLPAKFREELGESFYLARGFGNRCVQVLSKEQFDAISAKIMALPADKAMALQYVFTATAVEVVPNAQGRVIIPQTLREFASLEGDALVIGMNTRLEIWSKEQFDSFMNSQNDVIGEALSLLTL
ncbi:MAG: division/cell wall cluster transcriptional repressor MraZ [Ruminococcus sp.]|nr:division/cell wall cluster transcriptional repressor MraZ [Ruminococcus sp.]